MEKNFIDQVFENLQGKLDTAVPTDNHKAKFLEKLNAVNSDNEPHKSDRKIQWMRPLFIAASLLLLAGIIFTQFDSTVADKELADVSPEMQETQDFFTKTIERELFEIKENVTPENQAIVEDAIAQLETLENNYKNLKKDLSESGEDKRVIYAMIDNFQNRIDLLQNLLEQMEAIKKLKEIEDVITL